MVITMERRMNKQALEKENCPNDLFPLAVLQQPLIQFCPEYGVTMFGNILGAIYRVSYKLVQSSLGIRVISYFYFTKYHVTSVTLHLYHQWYHKKRKKQNSSLFLFTSYMIYLSILLSSDFVHFPYLLCPVGVFFLVFSFLVLYN